MVFFSALFFFIFLWKNCHGQANGFSYFYVEEGAQKCFIEDVPRESPITVRYHSIDNPGVPCSIVFKEENNKSILMSREVTAEKPSGRVTYLTKTGGKYQVCIVCKSTQWLAATQLKWSLSVELGEQESFYLGDAAKSHRLEELQSVLKLVKSKSALITAENEYERQQEALFRDTSESMNTRVVIFAILEISVIVTVTVLSVIHLSKFFRTQKLY